MKRKLIVGVIGATGKQGRAVAKSLLERGHEVRAITRSPDSAKAKERRGERRRQLANLVIDLGATVITVAPTRGLARACYRWIFRSKRWSASWS